MHHLDLALGSIEAGQEVAFINFVAKLLEILYYNAGYNKILYMRHALPIVICGVTSLARTDVCVMDNEILFVQVSLDSKDPGPQAMREAIAAQCLCNEKQDSGQQSSPSSFAGHHFSRHHYSWHQPYLLQSYRPQI